MDLTLGICTILPNIDTKLTPAWCTFETSGFYNINCKRTHKRGATLSRVCSQYSLLYNQILRDFKRNATEMCLHAITTIEKHIRTQISQLYRNVLLQQCNLEQKILKNALALATHSPDAFAYHVMQGPGYMALLAGEVIHIVKCVPVEVKLALTQECYDQLPVIRNNITYFLTPRTHILLRQGTQVTCNALTPAMYLLGDSWYRFAPRPVETLPPIILKSMTNVEIYQSLYKRDIFRK